MANENKKKILLVDDSALMRSVLCDIINSDERFYVQDRATNGLEALDYLRRKTYDAVVLDVNMPKMNGLELLKALQKEKIQARVMMASTDTKEGAKTTLDALELGALDFIEKPDNAAGCRVDSFRQKMISILSVVAESKVMVSHQTINIEEMRNEKKMMELVSKHSNKVSGNRVIAIASSTGGPKALQSVIPKIPAGIKAPIVLVQHMPSGFTASLAERLDSLSEVKVKEAVEGDVLEDGVVYLSRGGSHMNVLRSPAGKHTIHYTDEPHREGVKPCANYMYESLMNSTYDEIVCVVMTGMGADGTEGIKNLKTKKKIHVIAQEESTCAVYGMPKCVVKAALNDQIVPLEQIAQEIIMNVGVN